MPGKEPVKEAVAKKAAADANADSYQVIDSNLSDDEMADAIMKQMFGDD